MTRLTTDPQMLIVDDQLAFLEAVSLFFRINRTTQNIHSADTFQSALTLINSKKIDCALIDVNLKEKDSKGLELAAKLKKKQPNTKVILMSGIFEPHYLEMLRLHNLDGFLSKLDGIDNFETAVHRVLKNQKYFSDSMRRMSANYLNNQLDETIEEKLTLKERLVYKMLLSDKSYKVIAELINVEVNTLKKHASRIYKKLDVSSRISLINNARNLS